MKILEDGRPSVDLCQVLETEETAVLQRLEYALAALFKQATMVGTHLKDKASQRTSLLAWELFGCQCMTNILVFKGRHNIVYRTRSGESTSIDSETANGCKNYQPVYFSIHNLAKP
jgi:hypothetical protein